MTDMPEDLLAKSVEEYRFVTAEKAG